MLKFGAAGIFLYILAAIIRGTESLKCYKCLSLDCPEGGFGEKNERLCQSVRSFIITSINQFYEVGVAGYIGVCPAREETLQWTLLQQNPTSECSEIREGATCSLGRLQILTGGSTEEPVVSHATILGCLKPALLYHMKKAAPSSSAMACSIYRQNNTGAVQAHFVHHLMLENCPKATDYCNVKNFCVPFEESVVRVFHSRKVDHSFENGLIIGIIALIVVLVLVAYISGTCVNPLSRSSNYTPAVMVRTDEENSPAVELDAKTNVID